MRLLTLRICGHQSLISYIRSLPEEEQRSLTDNASDLAVDAMRKLSEMMILRGKEEGSVIGWVIGVILLDRCAPPDADHICMSVTKPVKYGARSLLWSSQTG